AMAERAVAYLAKGGDAEGAEVEDVLVRPGEPDLAWRSPRIATRHTHGTGCTLSSAIATALGRGRPLAEAIGEAREFVRAALGAAPGFGAGHGPMGHQAVR
ncbi:MAG TPA: bifunctional hydroxymethylpyrimidine kinase/phosphomethylpyrimidine kinase, partial [Croceibacterium sp.]